MANVKNTLYPPVIATFLPAFVNTGEVEIPFSLSPFNEKDAIKRIHISLTTQKSNENAFSYNCGIKFVSIAEALKSDGTYSVKISSSDLRGAKPFDPTQYYKVQIRFDLSDGIVKVPNTASATDVNKDQTEKPSTIEKEITNTGISESIKSAYLREKIDYFSEWSTVCLIRPILQPELILNGFDDADKASDQDNPAFNEGIIALSGKLFFIENIANVQNDSGSNITQKKTYASSYDETLQSYYIQVLDSLDDDKILYTTDTQYTSNEQDPNELKYNLDTKNIPGINGDENLQLRLRIVYTTRNQYTKEETWFFRISNFDTVEGFDPRLAVEVNNEDAQAILHFRNKNPIKVSGYFVIKRASSLDNFKTWKTVMEIPHTGNAGQVISEKTYIDPTVGSLYWYQYSVQFLNVNNVPTKTVYSGIYNEEMFNNDADQNPDGSLFFQPAAFIMGFYDAVVSRDDKQFTIKYNHQVANFKPTRTRTKIDTLGGKYPLFTENALLDYKQFSISGTISAEEDPKQLFLNKMDVLKDRQSDQNTVDTLNNYNLYKQNFGVFDHVRNDVEKYDDQKVANISVSQGANPITESDFHYPLLSTTLYDYLWEREFREELTKWLNDGEPKLYRSMTEGNLVVMLTDISLTPNKTLSRMVWDFSATVYEIEDGNDIDILDQLGIYKIPRADKNGDSEPDIPLLQKAIPGYLYKEQFIDKNTAGKNVITSVIYDRLKAKNVGVRQDIVVADTKLYIKNVKIHFQSQPHIYSYGNATADSLPGDFSNLTIENGRVLTTQNNGVWPQYNGKNTLVQAYHISNGVYVGYPMNPKTGKYEYQDSTGEKSLAKTYTKTDQIMENRNLRIGYQFHMNSIGEQERDQNDLTGEIDNVFFVANRSEGIGRPTNNSSLGDGFLRNHYGKTYKEVILGAYQNDDGTVENITNYGKWIDDKLEGRGYREDEYDYSDPNFSVASIIKPTWGPRFHGDYSIGGYFQTPKEILVSNLTFDMDDVVSLEYILEYKEKTNHQDELSKASIQKTIIGQYQDIFEYGKSLGDNIRHKYNYIRYTDTGKIHVHMQHFKGITLDVDPYSVVKIIWEDMTGETDYFVGDTGILDILPSFNVDNIKFAGKRMKRVRKERQPYLREWEFVLDDSVFKEDLKPDDESLFWKEAATGADSDQAVRMFQLNTVTDENGKELILTRSHWKSMSEAVDNGVDGTASQLPYSTVSIKHPKYNTVYRLADNSLVIYFLDGRWYPIDLYDLKKTELTEAENISSYPQIGPQKPPFDKDAGIAKGEVGIVKMPVQGRINYFGDILKFTYGDVAE